MFDGDAYTGSGLRGHDWWSLVECVKGSGYGTSCEAMKFAIPRYMCPVLRASVPLVSARMPSVDAHQKEGM
jgi:hypothetical protein